MGKQGVVYLACLVAVLGGRPAALFGAGHGWAQSAPSAIPDELAVIAAACRENSARIQTLQLSGTVIVTGRLYERMWDPIAGQTYNSQTREFSVWKDALNCRFDVTADRERHESGVVHYNVPFAEHIMSSEKLEREGGRTELYRKYGTPQSTERMIATPDKSYIYRPEENQLVIDSDGVMAQINFEEEMGLAFNRTDAGFRYTMAELVDRWAELAQRGDPRLLEVTPLGGGQYQIRSTIVVDSGAGKLTRYASEIVVDLEQGGNMLSYETQTDGQVDRRYQFDYMNVAGTWVLAHAEIAQFGPDGVLDLNAVYDVARESVRVNEPIDPRVFTFEALAVRRGAHVTDAKTGEDYLYDDVPLHVKAALAAAREREEELAEAAAAESEKELREAAAPAPQGPPPVQADELAQEPQQGQAGPPSAAAAVPTARATTGPSSIVVVTPQTRAAPPADTMPAHAPIATRPVATRPVFIVREAPTDRATPPSPAAESMVPRAALTAVVVSAGCAAALGIGIWKLMRRGTTPRAG